MNTLIVSIDLPTTKFMILSHYEGLNVFWYMNIFLVGSNRCTVNVVFSSLTVIISVYLSLFKSENATKWFPYSPSADLNPTSTSYNPSGGSSQNSSLLKFSSFQIWLLSLDGIILVDFARVYVSVQRRKMDENSNLIFKL